MSSKIVNNAGADSDISIPASPADAYNPLVRRESSANKEHQPQNINPESLQSSDTVPRLSLQLSYVKDLFNNPSHSSCNTKKCTTESVKPSIQLGDSQRDPSHPRPPKVTSHSLNNRRQKAKKSGVTHTTPSKVRAPHRGQEFSVDDGVSEVESNLNKSSRKQTSNSKRRPNVCPLPKLITVASEEEDTIENNNIDSKIVSGVFADVVKTGAQNLSNDQTSDHSVEDEVSKTNANEIDHDEMISDSESFTLKDRQQAINQTHPFGIRIWKPAIYKKNRSVLKDTEGDIHSSPGGLVSPWLLFFNLLWTIWFGWWLGLVTLAGAIVCFLFGAGRYGRVLLGLSGYLFYPFGKFVRLEQDQAYAHEDECEGRSVFEYEQWQNGDLEDGRLFFGPEESRPIFGRSRQTRVSVADENDSLLRWNTHSPHSKNSNLPQKRRLFGRGQWNTGRVIFFLFFYGLIYPLLILVSGICWFLVFWIPMGKVTMLLLYHLRRHPLAMSFQPDSAYSRGTVPNSSILVCTYRAVGLKYWKYTVNGTNIFLINLIGVVLFVVFDYFILVEVLGLKILIISHPAFLFIAALLSMIPLAYFIGQAVASISAQSSMGIAAAVNALFSTIVEVFFYCVALDQGKRKLVEGCIIGNLLAGILFLPGVSMCFGAIKRKTQRFNSQSVSATSTMLLFAVIAAFGPTLFYQIFGTHEMRCLGCTETHESTYSRDCRQCHFSQTPSLNDRFYVDIVRPFSWVAAILLFMAYVIGLWFTLRTHAAVIWNDVDDKKLQSVPNTSAHPLLVNDNHGKSLSHGNDTLLKESHNAQLPKRILNQSLKQLGREPRKEDFGEGPGNGRKLVQFSLQSAHQSPSKEESPFNSLNTMGFPGFTETDNTSLVGQVVDISANAATIAPHDRFNSSKTKWVSLNPRHISPQSKIPNQDEIYGVKQALKVGKHLTGGHDAPNWSRTNSALVLFIATVLFALVAEILARTTDVVLKNVSVSEKFLGITLIALAPNTSEFMNAISFAMNGNIALSIEIGSAYVLQVCLLQIPALVLYSSLNGQYLASSGIMDHKFSLIFPLWDMITITLCVFLLSNVYGGGKSNYFKGSILLLSYLFVITGFWLSDTVDL